MGRDGLIGLNGQTTLACEQIEGFRLITHLREKAMAGQAQKVFSSCRARWLDRFFQPTGGARLPRSFRSSTRGLGDGAWIQRFAAIAVVCCIALPAAAQQAADASQSSAAGASAAGSLAQRQAGEKIALKGSPGGALACVSCHGAHGEGSAAFPRLAGTGQSYLLEQLQAYGAGKRSNAIMQGVAKALTAPERIAVAAYFSSLPLRVAKVDESAVRPADAGAWLAARGRWADDIPACAQCHGVGGSGVGEHFPPLAGLPVAYIAQQLKDWRADARPPGPQGLMSVVAKRLKDADIEAVSQYYAQLSVAPVAPVSAVPSAGSAVGTTGGGKAAKQGATP